MNDEPGRIRGGEDIPPLELYDEDNPCPMCGGEGYMEDKEGFIYECVWCESWYEEEEDGQDER